jgi:hypothetical protein
VFEFRVNVQVPVPEQPPPLQPSKAESRPGFAVNVITVPALKVAEQVLPQLMPAGLELTLPRPRPDLLTVSVNFWTAKVAVTVVAAVIVTVHVPVPEQPPPLQPVNVEPLAGDAVSVTLVPLL